MRWFCSFKAYGDMVIACNFLRNVDSDKNGLLVGSHLSLLLNALEYKATSKVVETGNAVPAVFNVNKCGYLNAACSAIHLRKNIQEVLDEGRDTLVFDSLGLRQRFLAWPFHVETIGGSGDGNIYLHYARYLGIVCDLDHSTYESQDNPNGIIYIFPDSRIKEKELPDWLIIQIAKENEKYGKETILVKVGKSAHLPQFSSLQLQWVDGFDNLMTQIRKADLIVTADSLPAHLAEYVGIPVFVFSPIANDYWMPLSCFKNGYFSEFSSLAKYIDWISQH